MFKNHSLFKVLHVVTILICGASTSLRAGGDSVGNGGGYVESQIMIALGSLPRHIEACIQNGKLCGISAREAAILIAIQKNMPTEFVRNVNLVKFETDPKPEMFMMDGAMRMAVTGSSIGSSIHVNVPMLYITSPVPYVSPILPKPVPRLDYAGAVAMLIHEFAHHHGVRNHADADRLGGKVAAFLMRKRQVLEQVGLIYTRVMIHQSLPYDQILVQRGEDMVDVTDSVTDALAAHSNCSNQTRAEFLETMALSNLHWRSFQKIFSPNEEGAVEMQFNIAAFCGGLQHPELQAVMSMGADKEIAIKILDCSKDSAFCH